jgi:hypothetical protein
MTARPLSSITKGAKSAASLGGADIIVRPQDRLSLTGISTMHYKVPAIPRAVSSNHDYGNSRRGRSKNQSYLLPTIRFDGSPPRDLLAARWSGQKQSSLIRLQTAIFKCEQLDVLTDPL